MIPIVLLWIWTTLLVLYSNNAEETALQKPPAILLPPEEEQWLFWLGYKASCPFGQSSKRGVIKILGLIRIFWKNSVHDPKGRLAKNEHIGANCLWDIGPVITWLCSDNSIQTLRNQFGGRPPKSLQTEYGHYVPGSQIVGKTKNRTWWRLRLEYLLKSKMKCVKLSRFHVCCLPNIIVMFGIVHFNIIDCCRLLTIVIDFYRFTISIGGLYRLM